MANTKINTKNQNGFTLIELLIVIAILGVLAGVVLIALNPIEQLKRGRDSSRVAGVSQLGDAMVHYATGQNTATYPVASTTWQDTLKTAGEINNQLTAASGASACGGATNPENGYCYSDLSTQSNFVVWTNLESTLETSKLTSCASPKVAAAVYFGSTGKVQLDCLTTATTIPAATDTLVAP